MKAGEYLGRLLGVEAGLLEDWDAAMSRATGRLKILDKLATEHEVLLEKAVTRLNLCDNSWSNVAGGLERLTSQHERELRRFIKPLPGADEFDKAAYLAKKAGKPHLGFFLKKDKAREILERRRPAALLDFLGFRGVEELFKRYDVAEVFSALRFIESNTWMHQTFDEAYNRFTADDFEEREIEIRVLGPEWLTVAKKFVAKKHHNVSHLKEFGVIFLNPIMEDVPGKFIRDFSLLLHYYHEIGFYSQLFRRYAPRVDFTEKLKSLLRGDILEQKSVHPGEWLIVQRYLFKEDPQDKRLSLPRVNPESLHWARAEDNLASLGQAEKELGLEFWKDLYFVAGYDSDQSRLISFDLEDNAMSLVADGENQNNGFYYHQREALWTKLFEEYAGGRKEMKRLLLENFDKGLIKF